MCIRSILELKNFCKKSLESFDTGIAIELGNFQYWAKTNSLFKKRVLF